MARYIDADALMKSFCINKDGRRIPEVDCDNISVTVPIKDIKRIIREQPTAYDVDAVAAEMEEVLQDLNVLEILSHFDADSTIQTNLDRFLEANKNELLRIVRKGGAE